MGLIERVSARLDQRSQLAYPVGRVAIDPSERWFGHDDSNYSPEEYGDYVLTSNEVFSAVSLRARLAGTVSMRAYRGRDENKREMPESAPAQLLRYVNPFWTPARLARADEMSMCLWGESYWAVEKDQFGKPIEIWWLKPSRVTPVPHPDDYIEEYRYESNVNGQVLKFRPDEIVWQRYPNPLDEYSALSPIAAARLAADTASAMMKANRNLHKQGVQMAGVVSPKSSGPGRPAAQFSQPQATELSDMLEKRFAGADKAHKWAVLRFEAQFEPVTMSQKDAEFLGGLNLTLRQVCNAFGIPSPLLNDMEHATLANVREFQKALWEHGLKPDMELRAQDVEGQLLPMFGNAKLQRSLPDHVEYDFSRVAALQESEQATWDRERGQLETGAITINEWRRKHGMPSVKWGDVFWAPVNKAAVKDAKALPAASEPPADEPDEEPPENNSAGPWARVLAALDFESNMNGVH